LCGRFAAHEREGCFRLENWWRYLPVSKEIVVWTQRWGEMVAALSRTVTRRRRWPFSRWWRHSAIIRKAIMGDRRWCIIMFRRTMVWWGVVMPRKAAIWRRGWRFMGRLVVGKMILGRRISANWQGLGVMLLPVRRNCVTTVLSVLERFASMVSGPSMFAVQLLTFREMAELISV
jgi:hypothetical protein